MNTWYGTPQIESWLARQGQAAHRQSRWSREKITDQDDEQVSQMMAQHRTAQYYNAVAVQYRSPPSGRTHYFVSRFSALGTGHQASSNGETKLCIQTSGSHRPRVDSGAGEQTRPLSPHGVPIIFLSI